MEGTAAILSGWRLHKQGATWLPYLLFGIIGVLAGLLAMVWPGLTMVILVYMIGFWAVFGGISEIFMGISIRKTVERWWIMLFSGIISVLFGLLVIYSPFEGILMMIWCLAGFMLLIGIMGLLFAFRLKSQN